MIFRDVLFDRVEFRLKFSASVELGGKRRLWWGISPVAPDLCRGDNDQHAICVCQVPQWPDASGCERQPLEFSRRATAQARRVAMWLDGRRPGSGQACFRVEKV
jgi:hypothetical protein